MARPWGILGVLEAFFKARNFVFMSETRFGNLAIHIEGHEKILPRILQSFASEHGLRHRELNLSQGFLQTLLSRLR